MLELLRSGKVGTVTLLASKFFAANNRSEFEAARREATLFPGRWRIAAARSARRRAGSLVPVVFQPGAGTRRSRQEPARAVPAVVGDVVSRLAFYRGDL